MQELIIEIAIYLGIAAFLGFLLAYLIWGMGARRRIAAARAEGAAEVRTSVDGDSSLRTQIDNITRERDRLEHRVQVLSARVATLMEGGEDSESAKVLEEELGTVRLQIEARSDDPLDSAAAAFPKPLEEKAAQESIFGATETAVNDPPAPGAAGPETPKDPTRTEPAPDTAGAPATTPDRDGDTAAGEAAGEDEPDTAPPLRRHPRPTTDPQSDAEEGGSRKLFEAASSLRGGSPTEETAPSSDANEEPSAEATDPDRSSTDAAEARPEDTKNNVAPAPQDVPPPEAIGEAPSPGDAPVSVDQDVPVPDRPDHIPPGLLPEPPEAPDDLTRIKGIGKSTQKALNGKGIWTFSQLAAMSAEDIDWLHSELGGQMARSAEKWVEQAKTL